MYRRLCHTFQEQQDCTVQRQRLVERKRERNRQIYIYIGDGKRQVIDNLVMAPAYYYYRFYSYTCQAGTHKRKYQHNRTETKYIYIK